MKDKDTINSIKDVTGISTGVSVVMIILGILAIAMPLTTGAAVSTLFGVLIVFAGLLHFIYAFTATGPGKFIWRVLIGLLYIVGGAYLLVNAPFTLGALTLGVAIVFILEGILELISFFQVREMPGSGWLIFDGILAIALGVLIAYQWPLSAGWAIGTLVGINLLSTGFSCLFVSSAAKSELSAAH